MKLLGGGAATAVALTVALLVIGDVVISLAGVWHGAGWYALAVVAFPAFIGFGAWRGWGTPNY